MTAIEDGQIIRFIIGRIISVPEVYDPGELDDLCAKGYWSQVDNQLIDGIKKIAKEKGCAQLLIVCGTHDEAKRTFLKNAKSTIVSEWYVENV